MEKQIQELESRMYGRFVALELNNEELAASVAYRG